MLLFGSLLVMGASAAAMLEFNTYAAMCELASLSFVVSAFVSICAGEARCDLVERSRSLRVTRGGHRKRLAARWPKRRMR